MKISPVSTNYKSQNINKQSFGRVMYELNISKFPAAEKVKAKIMKTFIANEYAISDTKHIYLKLGQMTKNFIHGYIYHETDATRSGAKKVIKYHFDIFDDDIAWIEKNLRFAAEDAEKNPDITRSERTRKVLKGVVDFIKAPSGLDDIPPSL